jgi:hypothetical protein
MPSLISLIEEEIDQPEAPIQFCPQLFCIFFPLNKGKHLGVSMYKFFHAGISSHNQYTKTTIILY